MRTLAPDQSKRQALLAGEEAKPRLGVGGDAQVRLAVQAVPDLDRAVLDRDGRLALLHAGELEMEDGIETARLVGLKDERQEGQKSADRSRR